MHEQSHRTQKPREQLKRYVGATIETIVQRIPRIINSAISAIHLSGESGVGKEIVVDQFINCLPLNTPFYKINCGAIATSLLESELFGHVKGAFTGAVTRKTGLLEAASGGWIFLDELPVLSCSAQAALLRVIECKEIRPVGSADIRHIDVKIISASNEPICELVKTEKFRRDLWQRLCETEIYIPPLRERNGEIAELIHYFCQTMPGGPYKITPTALDVLCKLKWSNGNVRELRNCLRAMTELHMNRVLTPLSIPQRVWEELKAPETLSICCEEPIVSLSDNMSTTITVSLPYHQGNNFQQLTDQLLLELLRQYVIRTGRLSLRSFSNTIGMARSTLSGRLRGLVHKNLIDSKSLSELVGIREKG